MKTSAVVTRPVAVVLDSATVVRAHEIAVMLNNGQTLAQVGRNLGCSAATLSRFMRAAGYRDTTEWAVGSKENPDA